MLTTDSDQEAGVLGDTFYAAIPFHNPGIVIEYDMNSFELKFKSNVVKVNHATAMRDEKEYRLTSLALCKQALEDKYFLCLKRNMTVLVVLVEPNKDTLFQKEKSKCVVMNDQTSRNVSVMSELRIVPAPKPVRCDIAWAIGKEC